MTTSWRQVGEADTKTTLHQSEASIPGHRLGEKKGSIENPLPDSSTYGTYLPSRVSRKDVVYILGLKQIRMIWPCRTAITDDA